MTARLIAVVHLPPLPGSPRAIPLADVERTALSDARVLVDAGYTRLLVENFGDAPFFKSDISPLTTSCMTRVALRLRDAFPNIELGINVLRNDAIAALGIARAVGASFIRVNVLTGARVTDQGVIEGIAARLLRERAVSMSAIAIYADVDVKHSAPLAPYPLEQETHDVIDRGLADAVLVTGEGTGRSVDLQKLEMVKRAAKGKPVLVASGATVEMLPEIAQFANGVIVGSAVREEGTAGHPVDRVRATRFREAFLGAFIT